MPRPVDSLPAAAVRHDPESEIAMKRRMAPRLLRWLVITLIFGAGGDVRNAGRAGDEYRSARPAAEKPAGLEPIGGRWYVKKGDRPIYYFRDGDSYIDLFSYHARDSNKDGIANVRIRHDERFLLVDSQGYPNHPTAVFPNSQNPNRIRVQDFHFRFPLVPERAETVTRVPMGPIGMALNGVVFFNPFEAAGMNAIEGYSEIWLDSCCGHPQQEGVYHYHKFPSCVKTPFPDEGRGHSPVIGFAFDGYPVHGPYEETGLMARDLKGERPLDVCNGHSDPKRGYHYHVTPGRFPYLIGGYAGIPEPSNNRMIARMPDGAIVDNAQGTSRLGSAIRSVAPGTIERGRTHVIRIELDARAIHGGVPAGKPSWVQFGPFEAKKIDRQGNTIVAEIAVPNDASLGVLLDSHVEFASGVGSGPVTVFKKNDVLRVVD
jgi:YHYH protein